MLTLKGSDHARTSRNIKGFRSCRHTTGINAKYLDRGRIRLEEARRIRREARRLWLSRQWSGRFEPRAERLRVLPPSSFLRQEVRRP